MSLKYAVRTHTHVWRQGQVGVAVPHVPGSAGLFLLDRQRNMYNALHAAAVLLEEHDEHA